MIRRWQPTESALFADAQQRFDVLRYVNPWHQVCLICQRRRQCIGLLSVEMIFDATSTDCLKSLINSPRRPTLHIKMFMPQSSFQRTQHGGKRYCILPPPYAMIFAGVPTYVPSINKFSTTTVPAPIVQLLQISILFFTTAPMPIWVLSPT